MMIHGHVLPPFIYPPCALKEQHAMECMADGKHHCLPKSLAICASLVQVFYSRTAGSTDFIWKTIYAEQDRLYREVSSNRCRLILVLVVLADYISSMKDTTHRNYFKPFKLS